MLRQQLYSQSPLVNLNSHLIPNRRRRQDGEEIRRCLTSRPYRAFSLPKRHSARNASSPKLPARTGEQCTQVDVCLLNHARPIPQWFRLKTDTKIQVCTFDDEALMY